MEKIETIRTDYIDISANNMRQYIDRDAIFDLAADIKRNGLISPIVVRPKGDRFELVAGQRRLLAHRYSGIVMIRAIIRDLDDQAALAIMTSENLARVDVNPIDEAYHVSRMLSSYNNDVRSVAAALGRSVQWVRDRVTVSGMPDWMQGFLAAGKLKIGVALILVQILDEELCQFWTNLAVRDGISISMAEYWLAQWRALRLSGGASPNRDDSGQLIAPPTVVKLRCAIDGQEYDARTFRSILICEKNIEIFNAFVEAYRTPSSSDSPPSPEKIVGAPEARP